ncbi:unnamed protein product [Sphagnum troendelagicum]|uniref:Uncharacterized protein n=1 Tax=Sphagnum troendelagicum TaxID=128251 RepID=A0ABP0TQL0_9BRYO
MHVVQLFSFGFDYGPRVIPIEALTYWKLVPVKPEKDEEAPKKEKEQKLELKAKICCSSCIQKVKEELYYKVAGKHHRHSSGQGEVQNCGCGESGGSFCCIEEGEKNLQRSQVCNQGGN